MKTFMDFFLILVTYMQVVTFVASLCTYKKYSHTVLRYFPIYLGIVAFIEVFCFHFFKTNNVWLYNILGFFQIVFLAVMLGSYLPGKQRLIIRILTFLTSVFYIYSFVFKMNDFTTEPSTYGYVAGNTLLIAILILDLNHILKVENSNGLLKNLLFWICFGLLIFFTTTLPIFSISDPEFINGEFMMIWTNILFFSIMFCNLSLIYGFIWSKKKYTY